MHQNNIEQPVVTAGVKHARKHVFATRGRVKYGKVIAHRCARHARKQLIHILGCDYDEASVVLGHNAYLTERDIT